jgi:hypothetical protein
LAAAKPESTVSRKRKLSDGDPFADDDDLENVVQAFGDSNG